VPASARPERCGPPPASSEAGHLTTTSDVVVIGGGLVGLGTALALAEEHGASVLVLEAEPSVARHQSGRNSGVIHSGLYYAPGSAKAALCVEGRRRMEVFCDEEGVPRLGVGKLVVAVAEDELPALAELERRGRANGLAGLESLDEASAAEREPLVRSKRALWVPETSVTDFRLVAHAMARRLERHRGAVRTQALVTAIGQTSGGVVVETTTSTHDAAYAVVCAGLHADRLARLAGLDPGISIVPFAGVYRALGPRYTGLISSLVYPVPDARFPFLGVHITPTVTGQLIAGPSAVPALSRNADSRFVGRDVRALAGDPRGLRLIGSEWRFGLRQLWISASDKAFARELGRILPGVGADDLGTAPGGVRAQAVGPEGRLVDDFLTVTDGRVIHVLNAPSPAATASLAIGSHLAARALWGA
jgi:L-2-hydroxyglutarate oxidase